jgi:acetylornithine/N-succinyldiaminopimelate aminotransferase
MSSANARRPDMTGSDELRTRWDATMMRTYPLPPLAFVRGEGSSLVAESGERYLDFLSGIAVTSLGHGHPAVAGAVAEQVARLTHTSNLFVTEPAVALAERLAALAGWHDGRTFFCNSGAEANEAALKLARRHGNRGKHRVVALEGSFHGRTFATLEATGQPAKHEPFAPLAGFVDHVPHDDPDALAAAVGPETCAVLVEVIQGEGGVRPVGDDLLLAARRACDDHGALLVVDEIQTGIGRTGMWFAWQDTPVVPDVMTLAKGLGGGLPIGACVARGPAAEVFHPGDHASTFGGNPVTCAAALAVLDVIEREDLVARAAVSGARLRGSLQALVSEAPLAIGVRGRGLLVGLELGEPVAEEIVAACRDRYLVVNAIGSTLIRLAPPLNVTDEEIELALAVLRDALDATGARRVGDG